MWKNFFMIRVMELWSKLLREVVKSPFTHIFKTSMDVHLCNLLHGTCFSRQGGLYLLKSLPTPVINPQVILWFCENNLRMVNTFSCIPLGNQLVFLFKIDKTILGFVILNIRTTQHHGFGNIQIPRQNSLGNYWETRQNIPYFFVSITNKNNFNDFKIYHEYKCQKRTTIYTKCVQIGDHPSKKVILAQQSAEVAQKDIN